MNPLGIRPQGKNKDAQNKVAQSKVAQSEVAQSKVAQGKDAQVAGEPQGQNFRFHGKGGIPVARKCEFRFPGKEGSSGWRMMRLRKSKGRNPGRKGGEV